VKVDKIIEQGEVNWQIQNVTATSDAREVKELDLSANGVLRKQPKPT
jgi:hypothetical protein